jgi:hypothetical protein
MDHLRRLEMVGIWRGLAGVRERARIFLETLGQVALRTYALQLRPEPPQAGLLSGHPQQNRVPDWP